MLEGAESELAAVFWPICPHSEASFGFHINMTKTKAWWPTPLPSSDHDVRNLPCALIREPSIEILGAPIGENSACRHSISKRIAQVEILWDILRDLADPQAAYHLLRNCASACRLVYVLRCTPPHQTLTGADLFDFWSAKGLRGYT